MKDRQGKDKQISVWIDDKTAAALLKTQDKELIKQYVIEEYEWQLINRKESRRHQSLEQTIDNGFDFATDDESAEDKLERTEMQTSISDALLTLTERQRFIFVQYAVNGQSFSKIAAKMNLNKDTVREHYLAAIKKLRKFLK